MLVKYKRLNKWRYYYQILDHTTKKRGLNVDPLMVSVSVLLLLLSLLGYVTIHFVYHTVFHFNITNKEAFSFLCILWKFNLFLILYGIVKLWFRSEYFFVCNCRRSLTLICYVTIIRFYTSVIKILYSRWLEKC